MKILIIQVWKLKRSKKYNLINNKKTFKLLKMKKNISYHYNKKKLILLVISSYYNKIYVVFLNKIFHLLAVPSTYTFTAPLRDMSNNTSFDVNNINKAQVSFQLNFVNYSTPIHGQPTNTASNLSNLKRKNGSPIDNYTSEVTVDNVFYY